MAESSAVKFAALEGQQGAHPTAFAQTKGGAVQETVPKMIDRGYRFARIIDRGIGPTREPTGPARVADEISPRFLVSLFRQSKPVVKTVKGRRLADGFGEKAHCLKKIVLFKAV